MDSQHHHGNDGADAPQQCLYCDGFYGMSFGQYVCSTCHLFLFPEYANQEAFVGLTEQKSDDSDSGNEEPPDLYAVAGVAGGGGGGGAGGGGGDGGDGVGDGEGNEHDAGAGDEGGGGDGRRTCSPQSPLPPSPPPPPPQPAVDRLAERVERLSVPHPADGVTTASMGRLPPEVLLVIFGYLDDISMWAVSNVCKRWRHLLMSHVPDEEWHRFTEKRFPLFRALYRVHCWSYIYSKLIESAPCLLCLHQMTPHSRPAEDERSFRRRRLVHEQNALKSDPPEGIRASPLDDTYSHWQASITGPVGSAYEGGVFLLYLQVPDSYPLRPPVVRFITKVYHPNVSRHGDIGIDSIHHNWTLALTIGKVLISIQSLLTDPYCKICMEPAVGALCQRDWQQFVAEARACTWRHAMHDALMPPPEELRGRLAGGEGHHRQHRDREDRGHREEHHSREDRGHREEHHSREDRSHWEEHHSRDDRRQQHRDEQRHRDGNQRSEKHPHRLEEHGHRVGRYSSEDRHHHRGEHQGNDEHPEVFQQKIGPSPPKRESPQSGTDAVTISAEQFARLAVLDSGAG